MTCWVVVTASVLNLTASVTYIGTYATSVEAQTKADTLPGGSVLTISLPSLATSALPSAG